MRINALLRVESASDSDLVTLDDLHAKVLGAQGDLYDDGRGAVLTHFQGCSPPQLLTQESFDTRFAYMPASRVAMRLLAIPNVVLCGGSVYKIFCDAGDFTGSDFDYYVVGMDPNDEAALWRKVNEFLAVFRLTMGNNDLYTDCTAVRVSRTVLTIDSNGERAPKQQLVLRVYPTLASVIQAFDVDPCCMAYDGRTTYMTHAAARSLVTKKMILDPSRRSTTYEHRLIKYMRRGMSLVMPRMEMRPELVDTHVKMPHLEFLVQEQRGRVATVDIRPSDMLAARSDYDVMDHLNDVEDGLGQYMFRKNLENFVAGRVDSYALVVKLEETDVLMSRIIHTGYMRVGDFLPSCIVYSTFQRIMMSNRVMKAAGISGLVTLRKLLGMTTHMVTNIIELVTTNKEVDISDVIQILTDKILAVYDDKKNDRVDMWIKNSPGRQWTASNNPMFEDEEQYYGQWYCKEPDAPDEDFEQESSDEEQHMCMMCHEGLSSNETNVMILPCGHRMHMMGLSRACMGGFEWIFRHFTCPMCRRDVRLTKMLPARHETPLVVRLAL